MWPIRNFVDIYVWRKMVPSVSFHRLLQAQLVAFCSQSSVKRSPSPGDPRLRHRYLVKTLKISLYPVTLAEWLPWVLSINIARALR